MARLERGELTKRDMLERALHAVDEKVICDCFQRCELWTSGVSPVLLAMATLQAMLRSSPAAHYHCYSDAVQLLEYIHSEYPQIDMEEQYIDLLVDFKTKAVLYELFQEVVLTEELKEDVLTKYLGKPSLQGEREHTTYTTTEEYSRYLHAYARHGLETMLAANQECLEMRRTDLFNGDSSRRINNSMMSDLSCYLAAVLIHILPATPTQTPNNTRGGESANTSCKKNPGNSKSGLCNSTQNVSGCVPPAALHQQQTISEVCDGKGKRVNSRRGSGKGVLCSSGLESRGRVANQKEQRLRATDTTTNISSAGEATDTSTATTQLDGRGVRYNLRRQQGRDRREGDAVESHSEKDKSPRVQGRSIRSKKWAVDGSQEDYTSARDKDHDSDTDTNDPVRIERRGVKLTHYGLSPPNMVRPGSTRRTDDLPAYATPSRMSMRLIMRQLKEDKRKTPRKNQSSQVHPQEQGEAFDMHTKPEVMNLDTKPVGAVKSLPVERKHYHLRQRGKSSNESEATGTSETENMTRTAGVRGRITTRQKRKRSISSDLSESSDCTASAATTRASLSTGASPWRRDSRPKRHVKFHESPNSSAERDKGSALGRPKKTNTRASKVECNGDACANSAKSSPHSSNRRKQGNPRKLLRQKMTSKVHFSQHNVDSDGSSQTDHVTRHRRAIEGGCNSPRESKQMSTSHSLRHVMIQSSDSSSESETGERVVLRMQPRSRRTRHQPHYTSSAKSSAHRVVNLADNYVEQSQPNSQWDYVAVQAIAAAASESKVTPSTANPGHCVSPVGRDRPHTLHRGTSDIESDHERTSVVTCSSDEFIMSTHGLHPQSGGDKLSVVSESSPGALSPLLQPALYSIHRLRKRAH